MRAFYADPFVDMHKRVKEALVLLGRLPRAPCAPATGEDRERGDRVLTQCPESKPDCSTRRPAGTRREASTCCPGRVIVRERPRGELGSAPSLGICVWFGWVRGRCQALRARCGQPWLVAGRQPVHISCCDAGVSSWHIPSSGAVDGSALRWKPTPMAIAFALAAASSLAPANRTNSSRPDR
jgi:hypothetical protein